MDLERSLFHDRDSGNWTRAAWYSLTGHAIVCRMKRERCQSWEAARNKSDQKIGRENRSAARSGEERRRRGLTFQIWVSRWTTAGGWRGQWRSDGVSPSQKIDVKNNFSTADNRTARFHGQQRDTSRSGSYPLQTCHVRALETSISPPFFPRVAFISSPFNSIRLYLWFYPASSLSFSFSEFSRSRKYRKVLAIEPCTFHSA